MTAQARRRRGDTMLDNIAAMGPNTVFLQVRPSADALYRYFFSPRAATSAATAALRPTGTFDGSRTGSRRTSAALQLHAWINPYRITRNGREELDALPESSPARQHPEWVVEYDGNYYFNPGLPGSAAARRGRRGRDRPQL